jgi:hypothetical protein
MPTSGVALLKSFLALAAFSSVAFASQALTPAEAKSHIGETATVCGKVVGTHYAAQTRGQPTFINLDKPYPNSPFTVVIWGTDRAKFGAPDTSYQDHNICVTGQIKEYRNAPEIVASDPKQIKTEDGPNR